jgi:hypothetical protein
MQSTLSSTIQNTLLATSWIYSSHTKTHRNSRRSVRTRCSIDWKLVYFVLDPLHVRMDFTLESCADDEGLNSHCDLPHSSPSDSVVKRDLSGEVCSSIHHGSKQKHVACHFERCRRTCPAATMDVFALPKWAKLNTMTRRWKLHQELPTRTQLFTR